MSYGFSKAQRLLMIDFDLSERNVMPLLNPISRDLTRTTKSLNNLLHILNQYGTICHPLQTTCDPYMSPQNEIHELNYSFRHYQE